MFEGDPPNVLTFLWNEIMESVGIDSPSWYFENSAHFRAYSSFEESWQRFQYDFAKYRGTASKEYTEIRSQIDPYFDVDLNSWYAFEEGNVQSAQELNIGLSAMPVGGYFGVGVVKDDKGFKQNYFSLGGGFTTGNGVSLTYNRT